MSLDDAWAAGFVDGEGCFHLQKIWPRPKVGDNWKPRIEVAQTDERPILKLQTMFGGRVLKLKRRANRRQVWRWDLCGVPVEKALRRLIPYLVVKKEQAEIVLEYCSIMSHDRGYRLTPECRELRSRLVTKLLNERKDTSSGM